MSSLTALLEQNIHIVPEFTLECGETLREVPVAYKTWGKLNEAGNNVMIICHAFTGSADVEDWWGPLMGRGKVFDPNRFFIFCANVLGSPYGSASPITINPDTGKQYGPEFPPTAIRDDVRIHKLVLDSLGVKSVAVAIGGSMGGMAVLEWPLCSPRGYIKHIVPLATSSRHSAWCISWGEAQRQSIYSDPAYEDGFYRADAPPSTGLGAARMSALLTYRSRDSFESRFGRKPQAAKAVPISKEQTEPTSPSDSVAAHNDGHRNARPRTPLSEKRPSSPKQPQIFSAQSYLRYQGDKFTARFDANCYIHITRKMDTHDVARGRSDAEEGVESIALGQTLATIPGPALVISIASDALFTTTEQIELAAHIPDAELVVIPSLDGHDGFLLEFEVINTNILRFLKRVLPDLYRSPLSQGHALEEENEVGFEAKKTSVFGEVDVDVANW